MGLLDRKIIATRTPLWKYRTRGGVNGRNVDYDKLKKITTKYKIPKP